MPRLAALGVTPQVRAALGPDVETAEELFMMAPSGSGGGGSGGGGGGAGGAGLGKQVREERMKQEGGEEGGEEGEEAMMVFVYVGEVNDGG